MSDIALVREKMQGISEKSHALYEKAVKKNPETNDPTTWIANQDEMRDTWERYKQMKRSVGRNYKELNWDDKEISMYMKFMYDNYPPGFGAKLREMVSKPGKYDPARVFIELSKLNESSESSHLKKNI